MTPYTKQELKVEVFQHLYEVFDVLTEDDIRDGLDRLPWELTVAKTTAYNVWLDSAWDVYHERTGEYD